jgi:hypothetical protein
MIKPIKGKELLILLEARADRDRFKTWGGEELLQLFLKFKDRMSSPENDMTYWTSTKTPHKPEELKTIIAKLQKKAEKKSEEQKLIEEGAEKIFEDNKWLVYHITNFEACQTYGAGTRWCITGRNNDGENAYGNRYWRSYTSDGAEFYFFLLKGTNEKYALTVWPDSSKGRLGMGDGSYDLNQADDDPITYIPDAPKVPNLPDVSVEPDFYTNEDEENEDEENEDDGEPAGPPVPPPYTLEPVANPQAMEFPASSLEDALRQFNNATAVAQLRNDLHVIKFGDNKFTVFVFNGTAGGPLMTQRGPGQFSLLVFDNQETIVNWAQQNMPNIQVQNQADANQPQQIENNDEEENDEEVEESMAKLSKEVKKGEKLMEKELNLKELGTELTSAEQATKACQGTSWCIVKPEWFKKYKDAGYQIFVKGSGKDAIGSLVKDGKVVQKVDATDRQLESYLEGVKPMNEWFRFDTDTKTLEQKYGKEIKTWEEMQVAAKGSSWGMAGDVGFDGKGIPESGKRYWDMYTKNGGKFFLSGTGDSRVLTLVELEPKITRFDAMDRPVADESLEEAKKPEGKKVNIDWKRLAKELLNRFVEVESPEDAIQWLLLSDFTGDEVVELGFLKDDVERVIEEENLEEAKKPVMESKKPIKEGVRLVYNPREKKTVKEEVKLSFDGEPLPVDIKESNTHTKLRLLRHK